MELGNEAAVLKGYNAGWGDDGFSLAGQLYRITGPITGSIATIMVPMFQRVQLVHQIEL